jgi:hypothetical protein
LLQLENIGVNIIVKDKARISSDQNEVSPSFA